jgi:hypothetical protein
MFELEDDSLKPVKKKKIDDYDYDYAIAVSKSLLDLAGTQIWSPEEVQKMIDQRLNEL